MARARKIVASIFAGSLALVLFIVCALSIWGVVEPRFLDEENQTASVTNLPPQWQGEKIAVIADVQLGLFWDNEGTVAEAVEQILVAKPAAALIAGDFLYEPTKDTRAKISRVVAHLKPLTDAGIPTYAVLGNHDYGVAHPDNRASANSEIANDLETALEDIGIEVLQNEVTMVPHPNGGPSLRLVGLGSLWAGGFDPGRAFSGLPTDAPRIVMMHNPDGFSQLPAHQASFTIAAHTHGGQIRIPFAPHWTWLTYVRSNKVHADGWVEDGFGAAGNDMYINRGIGMSVMPVRINALPELTFFTLVRGEGDRVVAGTR